MSRKAQRLHVDWTRCCVELLPELLAVDDWGFPVSRSGERDPVVPAVLEGHARRAQKACPLLALRLIPAVTRAP
jgi:ferredoxin